MFGNILNNAQVTQLRSTGQLTIEPFDQRKFKLAHYPVSPGGILWAGAINENNKRQFQPRHNFLDGSDYVFEPNEYAIIEIAELISIKSDGIVGQFIPSSNLIEFGFGLTAGKIDPKYGELQGKRQKIIFGIKNLRAEKNILKADQNVAHIYFVDLRGLNNLPVEFNSSEFEAFLKRYARFKKADEDGPTYP